MSDSLCVSVCVSECAVLSEVDTGTDTVFEVFIIFGIVNKRSQRE